MIASDFYRDNSFYRLIGDRKIPYFYAQILQDGLPGFKRFYCEVYFCLNFWVANQNLFIFNLPIRNSYC